MEAEKTDYCSCPNKKCPIHGNCFYCVQIHRGHGGHLPYCMFEMVNKRLAGLASLTEGTLKSYMSKHPDVCSGIPIHKSNEVDEQDCFIIILKAEDDCKVNKFQFVGEFYLKEYATVRRGFFFVFSSSVFGFRLFD